MVGLCSTRREASGSDYITDRACVRARVCGSAADDTSHLAEHIGMSHTLDRQASCRHARHGHHGWFNRHRAGVFGRRARVPWRLLRHVWEERHLDPRHRVPHHVPADACNPMHSGAKQIRSISRSAARDKRRRSGRLRWFARGGVPHISPSRGAVKPAVLSGKRKATSAPF